MLERFWWKVVVCSNSLRCQLNPGLIIFLNNLAQTEVDNFYDPLMEDNVAWLEVIVDHSFFEGRKVVESTNDLFYDDFCLSFRYSWVFFDVFSQLRTVAVLKFKNNSIFGFIKFNDFFKASYVRVVEVLLNIYLSFNMPKKLISVFSWNFRIKSDLFDSHNLVGLNIVTFVDLSKTTLPKKLKSLIFLENNGPSLKAIGWVRFF